MDIVNKDNKLCDPEKGCHGISKVLMGIDMFMGVEIHETESRVDTMNDGEDLKSDMLVYNGPRQIALQKEEESPFQNIMNQMGVSIMFVTTIVMCLCSYICTAENLGRCFHFVNLVTGSFPECGFCGGTKLPVHKSDVDAALRDFNKYYCCGDSNDRTPLCQIFSTIINKETLALWYGICTVLNPCLMCKQDCCYKKGDLAWRESVSFELISGEGGNKYESKRIFKSIKPGARRLEICADKCGWNFLTTRKLFTANELKAAADIDNLFNPVIKRQPDNMQLRLIPIIDMYEVDAGNGFGKRTCIHTRLACIRERYNWHLQVGGKNVDKIKIMQTLYWIKAGRAIYEKGTGYINGGELETIFCDKIFLKFKVYLNYLNIDGWDLKATKKKKLKKK